MVRRTINPPALAAAVAFGVSVRSGSGSWEASSLWVPQSRLGAAGAARGRSAEPPVWSSERLFPTTQTKRGGCLITHIPCTSAPPSASQVYSGLRNDTHAKVKTVVYLRDSEGLSPPASVLFVFGSLHSFWRCWPVCQLSLDAL